jgi:hypothetical protein
MKFTISAKSPLKLIYFHLNTNNKYLYFTQTLYTKFNPEPLIQNFGGDFPSLYDNTVELH